MRSPGARLRVDRAWLMVVVVAVCAAVAPPVAADVSDTPDVVSFHADYGPFGGDPRHWTTHGSGDDIRVEAPAQDLSQVVVNAHTDRGLLTLEFQAPPGEQLTPGVYDDTVHPRSAGEPGRAAMRIGFGCDYALGRFTVLEVRMSWWQEIERLWITYEFRCEGQLDVRHGEIRVGLDQPTGLSAPTMLVFPDTDPAGGGGIVTPVSVAAHHRQERVTAVEVTGQHPDDFIVEQDGCAGAILDPGQRCEVALRFAPGAAGPRHALLHLTAADGGRHTVMLDGSGTHGRTKLQFSSEPGDPIGDGGSYTFTPADGTFSGFHRDERVLEVAVVTDSGYWRVHLQAPQGEQLQAGRYTEAERYPAREGRPGLLVSTFDAPICTRVRGEFTIHELEFDTRGRISTLAADVEQYCGHSEAPLRGTVEFRRPVGDTQPPATVTSVRVDADDHVVDLAWANPADDDHATTLVRYLPGDRAPSLPTAGLLGYAGAGTGVRIGGLEADRGYALALFTVDDSGNGLPPVTVTVDPRRTPAPDDDEGQTRVVRLAGSDRIMTAIAMSQAGFEHAASTVVLTRADDYADALTAAPLAKARRGPVLLNPTSHLHPAVAEELRRVLPHYQARVYLLGGTQALSEDVEQALREMSYRTIRIAGETRYETALGLAAELGHPDTVLLASGTDYPDALSAGAAAAAIGAAVLLTLPDQGHAATRGYLEQREATAYAIGGPAARAHPEATPVVGATREETAVEVARRFLPDATRLGLARSDAFPDALAGGAHSAHELGPVLLTPTADLHPATAGWLCARGSALRYLYVYGGHGAISPSTEQAVAAKVSPSAC